MLFKFSFKLFLESNGLLDTLNSFLLEIIPECKASVIHLIFDICTVHSVIGQILTVAVHVCVLDHVVVIIELDPADIMAADGAYGLMYRKVFSDRE